MIANIQNPYRFVSGALYPADALVYEYTTTSSPQTVALAWSGVPTINMTADWGDGSGLSTITAPGDADRIHEYTTAGTYIVQLRPVVIGSGEFGLSPARDTVYSSDVYMTKMIQLGTIVSNFTVTWDDCLNMDWTGHTGNMNNVTPYVSAFSAGLRGCQISTMNFDGWIFPVNSSNMFWAGHGFDPIGISGADFTAVTNGDIGITTLFSFTTSVYDDWLQALNDQSIVHGVTWNFGTSTYSASMSTIRASLIADKGLTITDGGVA